MAEQFYFSKLLASSFETALERVTEALTAHGFGILCDIDVDAKLHDKLGVELPRYKILGACAPDLAHRALLANDQTGLLMPCSVVVQQRQDGVEVSAGHPHALLEPGGRAVLDAVADEAHARLQRVFAEL